jgi:hypothetical protein
LSICEKDNEAHCDRHDYCFAIENFNADAVMDEFKHQGLKPLRPGGSDRVYFPDPDGLEVQLASIDHHA